MSELRGGQLDICSPEPPVLEASSETVAQPDAEVTPLELMPNSILLDAYASTARRCARILSVRCSDEYIPNQYKSDFEQWKQLEDEVARRRFPTKHPMGFYSCGMPVRYSVDARLPEGEEPEQHAGRYLIRFDELQPIEEFPEAS